MLGGRWLRRNVHAGHDAPNIPKTVQNSENSEGRISKDEEYHLAFAAAGWGIWLLLPIRSFPSSPTYQVMAGIAPEWVWGASFLALGVVKFAATWRGTIHDRRMVSFWACFAWLFLIIAHLWGNSASAAGIVYLSMAGASAGRYWRLGRARGYP